MKIAFVTNKTRHFVEDDIQKAIEYLKEKTPLDFTYDIIDAPDIKIAHTLFFQSDFDNTFWMGTFKVKEQLRPLIPEDKYHAVCFIYDQTGSDFYNVKGFTVASWSFFKPLYPRTEYTEVATQKKDDDADWTWKIITHELIHAMIKRANRMGRNVLDEMDKTWVKGKQIAYYKNDNPYATDGNYAKTLANLAGSWDMVDYMPVTWRYFTKAEVKGLNTELVDRLDEARDIAGIPFILNSTLRSEAKNEAVGGVENSSHLSGHAVDIRCKTSQERMAIIFALYQVGFKRIGVGNTFVHADNDPSKPQKVMWLY